VKPEKVNVLLLMFTVTAPLHKGIEVTKTFLKAVETPPPPYLRSRGVYTTYDDEGYKWYNIVEIDDKRVSEGLTELMKRTVPFDSIEGLRIRMEILTSMRVASKVVNPSRVTTGFADLDELLFGGIPQNYTVILTSSSCDERELLVRRFLCEGVNRGEVTFYVTTDPGKLEALVEESEEFHLFICNPQADKIIKDLPNVHKIKGVENLSEISIAVTSALRKLKEGPKRACIEIISDVLLQHHSAQTRKWLGSLIPELRSKGFTTLAVMDPEMHLPQEARATLDLFEGQIDIGEKKTDKGYTRFLRIKKMYAQKYHEEEVPLKRESLQL
jgi:KaiC/GvpD/RAD55 family RecA-like ATPase